MHYLVIYDVVDDYVEARKPHRAAHFAHANTFFNAGQMILAGALADPADQALFVFREHAAATRFAENDPYVKNGIVKAWRVRNWTVVLGDGVEPPKL
jgi:uncharacterized protein YciI